MQIYKQKKLEFEEAKSKSRKTLEEYEEFKEPQIYINELLELESQGLLDEKIILDQIETIIITVIICQPISWRHRLKYIEL